MYIIYNKKFLQYTIFALFCVHFFSLCDATLYRCFIVMYFTHMHYNLLFLLNHLLPDFYI